MPEVPEKVDHEGGLLLGRISQRKAACGSCLLFELTRHMGIDRQMARIMGTGCELVHKEFPALGLKERDT